MATTTPSKRAVYRIIAEHPNYHWPYYRIPNTECTATDLEALGVRRSQNSQRSGFRHNRTTTYAQIGRRVTEEVRWCL
ncbi:hypothetical protein [Halocatena marina]|uniref:hypothetical protein n=1 Tax=Halocatena marina TaxID=2934937 RepID=UPI00201016AF|nr:hypothetical protein [Halocatena marina]